MKIHFHQSELRFPAGEDVVAEVSAALNEAAVHIFPAYFLWGLVPGELVHDPEARQNYHNLAKQLGDLAAQANINLAASATPVPAVVIAPGVNQAGQAEFLCLTEGQGGRWVTGTSALSSLLTQILGAQTICRYGPEPFNETAAIYLHFATQPRSLLQPSLPPANFKGAYFSLAPVGWSYAQQWHGGSEGHCQQPVQLPYLQPGEIVLESSSATLAPFPQEWQQRELFLRWDTTSSTTTSSSTSTSSSSSASSSPPQLQKLSGEEMTRIEDAIIAALRSYAQRNQRPNFLIGLSGGLDSAYVLAMLAQAIKPQHIEAMYLPSSYSSSLSCQIAEQLARHLQVKLWHVPIKFPHKVLGQHLKQYFGSWEGLPDENLQARLRMLILYARANQTGAHVLNTSNKSEIAMGFSTMYGDSIGAYSILGDLFKTEIFQLAEHFNERFGKLIPPAVISRPPSAELHADQKDEDRLPPYAELDPLLEGLLSYQKSKADLIQAGFSKDLVERAVTQWQRSAFKRWPSMPILNLRSNGQGLGRQRPLEA